MSVLMSDLARQRRWLLLRVACACQLWLPVKAREMPLVLSQSNHPFDATPFISHFGQAAWQPASPDWLGHI